MAASNLCLLVTAVLCAAAFGCTASPVFGNRDDRIGVQPHVEAVKDDSDFIKIQNRLPAEDVDVLAMSCKSVKDGAVTGDLVLEEVSPYATVWSPSIYGEVDTWTCNFEWVGKDLVIDDIEVWDSGSGGSSTWKLDASGIEIFNTDSNSYDFATEWSKKSGEGFTSA